MLHRRHYLLLSLLLFLPPTSLEAKDENASPAEPQVSFIFPQAGRNGTTLEAEILGENLEGAHTVWFKAGDLHATIKNIELIEPKKKRETSEAESEAKEKSARHRVLLRLEIHSTAPVGTHSLRVVAPGGISNALRFHVVDKPVLPETEATHDRPYQAQKVSFPVVVNGRIEKGGEVDYYTFEAAKGQQLAFEVMGTGFDPHLALYEPTGSWFNARQVTRLAFNDERKSRQSDPSPRLTYLFSRDGRYLVKVGSFLAKGGPDAVYHLRIAAQSNPEKAVSARRSEWQEHAFTRTLNPNRLQDLWSRTVRAVPPEKTESQPQVLPARGPSVALNEEDPEPIDPGVMTASIKEEEPNDAADHAQSVSSPVVITGAIDRVGDIDSFKFDVRAEEKLAFEIETPQSEPPRFNPRLELLDPTDHRLWTKIEERIQAKTVQDFESGGEYVIQIGDITSRYADPSFQYRLMIRPQIPHVGEIQIKEDRINLPIGQAKNLTVTVEQEERFKGEMALVLEGLPTGLQALPGTELSPDQKERKQQVTLVIMASENAPLTTLPHVVRLLGRPIVGGVVGPSLPAGEIPLMVIRPRQNTGQARQERQ